MNQKNILSQFSQKKTIDENITIEVSTKCNQSCTFCFARCGQNIDFSLRESTVKDILLESRDLGYDKLHLTGGEPLLWSPLVKTIEYALKIGFKSVFINSNGTLIDPLFCKVIDAYKRKIAFSISLQGPENIHDSLRGKGSYKKAINGIELLLSSGIDVSVFTSVGKTLLTQLPAYIDTLFNTFPDIINVALIQLIRTKNGAFNHELLNANEYRKLIVLIAHLNLLNYRIILLENPLANVVSKVLRIPWIEHAPPLVRKGRVTILANRDITYAHSSDQQLGKYAPGILEKLVSSDEYTISLPDTEICYSCSHQELCNNNGMAYPTESNRNFNEDHFFCKQVLDSISEKS